VIDREIGGVRDVVTVADDVFVGVIVDELVGVKVELEVTVAVPWLLKLLPSVAVTVAFIDGDNEKVDVALEVDVDVRVFELVGVFVPVLLSEGHDEELGDSDGEDEIEGLEP